MSWITPKTSTAIEIAAGYALMNAKIVGSVMKVPKSTYVKAKYNKTPPIKKAKVVSRIKIIANHNILCAVSVLNFFSPFSWLRPVTSSL